MEEVLYFTLSGLIVVLGVLSVFAARSAMQKGLTYSALAAVVWTLSILVVARAWHALYEIFRLRKQWAKSRKWQNIYSMSLRIPFLFSSSVARV